MKNIIYLFVLILVTSFAISCEKENQSPEEQLVSAVEQKANVGDNTLNVMMLKTNDLCQKVDCSTGIVKSGKTTINIYTREDLFMRAAKFYFRLAQWTDAPEVIAIGERGKILTDQQVEHKCRGN